MYELTYNKMNWKKSLKYLLSLAIAGLMLYFAFRGIDWNSFMEGLKQCRWGFIALSMAASVLAFFFRSERWRLLIKPFDPGMDPLTTFNGVNIGYLANFAFPRLGEVVRCGFISRRSKLRHKKDGSEGVSFDKVLGTVLLSRTWDLAVIFILLGLLLVTRWQKFGDFFTSQMAAPLSGRFNISVTELLGIFAAIVALIIALMWMLRSRSRLVQKALGFIKGIFEGFRSIVNTPQKGRFLVLTLLLWSMYWLMSMSIVWAMPQIQGLNWIDAWFLCLAGSIAWIIPVPGGFGAYHWVVAMALSGVYGHTWADGILYATLNHEAQAITMVVCGFTSYIIEVLRK